MSTVTRDVITMAEQALGNQSRAAMGAMGSESSHVPRLDQQQRQLSGSMQGSSLSEDKDDPDAGAVHMTYCRGLCTPGAVRMSLLSVRRARHLGAASCTTGVCRREAGGGDDSPLPQIGSARRHAHNLQPLPQSGAAVQECPCCCSPGAIPVDCQAQPRAAFGQWPKLLQPCR